MKSSKTKKLNKNKNKNKSRKIKNILHKSYSIEKSYGGSAIASGGFGCVFKPHLRCSKNTKQSLHRRNVYISKLMRNKYAEEEMKLINSVMRKVKNVPNYKDFFLISDTYMCRPKTLTKKDLLGFNSKCKNLRSVNITKKNINKNLSQLKILNIPYGGIDIDNYFEKWNSIVPSVKRNESFVVTNNSLIKLLREGIVKMNEHNYYHFDVKGGNILRTNNVKKGILDVKNIKTRLIDWGLSSGYGKNQNIPKTIKGRPLQYNLPFSVLLMRNDIQKEIDYFIEMKKNFHGSIDKMTINIDLSKHLFEMSLLNLGDGHLEYIIYIFETLQRSQYFGKNIENTLNKNIGYEIIISYMEQILKKYMDNAYHFNVLEYFEEIFLKNVDVWGFLVSYIDLAIENKNAEYLRNAMCSILSDFCFTDRYAVKVIPVDEVTSRLENLNNVLVNK